MNRIFEEEKRDGQESSASTYMHQLMEGISLSRLHIGCMARGDGKGAGWHSTELYLLYSIG